MVKEQIINRGITNSEVIRAMRSVPREEFVSSKYKDFAYDDNPLPIGKGQTILQPYIVAYMTEKLNLKKNFLIADLFL